MRVHVDEARRTRPGGVDDARGLTNEPRRDATIRSPSTATSASRAGAPVPSISEPFRTRSDQATRYSSVIVTDVIRSPCLMRSTCSMPDTTRPNTVYWPSRCAVARSRCRTGYRRVRVLAARHRSVPRRCFCLLNSALTW